MKEYKQSRYWDMNISLSELLNNNNEAKLCVNYNPHKSDDCFNRFVLGLKHPNGDTLMIGIAEDGFVYVGGFNIKTYKTLPVNKAMNILEKYAIFRNSLSDFNSEIIGIIDEDCINISYKTNYQLENKESSEELHYN